MRSQFKRWDAYLFLECIRAPSTHQLNVGFRSSQRSRCSGCTEAEAVCLVEFGTATSIN
ncbi:hypothetical protein DPMN_091757 [Dreissena polymorpha]|uniref:Uncharacterized protein n=1 Tax=Dreissena polymorpha TaxID=45954 RepID=A0A9D4R092_DREPO|nr:hypothetical protein DPMN_091757 [Dreissena polymorpha]